MMVFIPLSALLLYFAFPNIFHSFGFWPCGWIFAVPLLFALEAKPLGQRLGYGILFGLIFYFFLLQWFIPYSLLGYIVFSLAWGIQPVIFAALLTTPFKNRFLNVLYPAAAWVASEYIRTLLLGGFSWTLGFSQSFNPYAIQIAELTGSYGVSFVLIFVSTCIYRCFKNLKEIRFYGSSALGAILLVYVYGFFTIPLHHLNFQKPLQIATIQPNVSPREKIDQAKVDELIDQQMVLSREALLKHSPDFIIWPETAIPSDFLRRKSMRETIKQLATEAQAPLLIGAALRDEGKLFNGAVLLDSRGDVLEIYHKQHLVPFSEFMPRGKIWQWLKKRMNVESYTFRPGDKVGIMTLPDGTPLGVAICNEEMLGSLFQEFSRQGAGLVVILLNDGWFKQDIALIIHAQHAIIYAVENRIPVVRAANTGWSVAVRPTGVVDGLATKATTPLNTRTFALHAVRPHRQRTVYNIIGDTFCGVCICFVIMNFVAGWTDRKRKS